MPNRGAWAPLLVLAIVAATCTAETFKKSVDSSFANPHPRLAGTLDTENGNLKIGHGSHYTGELLSGMNATGTIYAGQEVRFLVSSSFVANDTWTNDATGRFAELERHTLSTKIFQNQYYGRSNWTSFPAFNFTGPSNVRVRVISAYASRGVAGTTVACDAGSAHDVWAEFWGMAPRVTAWGNGLAYSGFVTFTAPPFAFRVCVKDINERNTTTAGYNPDKHGENGDWREFRNFLASHRTFRVEPPLFLFSTAASNAVGDFAAISVFPHTNGVNRPNGRHFDPYSFSTYDHVKLVPSGLPCTYEKDDSSATRRLSTVSTSARKQYCGANLVNPATGNYIDSNCALEGAVEEGVAHIGTSQQNPLAGTSYPHDWVTSGAFPNPNNDTATQTWLVGYTRFAATGEFDVCVSTRAYRWNAFNSSLSATIEGGYARNAHPLWFKAYNANTSSCATVAHQYNAFNESCTPTNASFQVTTAASDVTWTMTDRRAGSWGQIEFASTNTDAPLQFTPATRWDHSVPRDYAYLEGGDQFRLVHDSQFGSTAAQSDFGELYKKSDGSRFEIDVVTSEESRSSRTVATRNRIDATATSGSTLLTSGEGALKQYWFGVPGLGTSLSTSSSGCFFGGEDNYGRLSTAAFNGAPDGQCCAVASDGTCHQEGFCSMTDAGWNGPRASADLGGSPRETYAPWSMDGSGTNAYGYIRVPPGGTYHVCYRRPGGNWRIATLSGSTNTSFAVQTPQTHLSYYLNDTTADSWGQWRVSSTLTDLTHLTWNYYTAPTTTATGSILKVVLESESCMFDSAQPRSISMRPGTAECVPDASSSTSCRASAFTSSSAVQDVYFYMMVPSYLVTATYRVCFRKEDTNWVILPASSFTTHTYMATASAFHPLPARSVAFRIDDRRQGTRAFIRFSRAWGFERNTPPLNAQPVGVFGDGDMIRLLPNATGVGETQLGCDVVYGATVVDTPLVQAQGFDTSLSSTDLGIVCNETSTGSCASTSTAPVDGGILGTYPTSDVNLAADDRIIAEYDGTVAVVDLPSRTTSGGAPQAYKVCYKQAGRNWLEAVDNVTGRSYFHVARQPSHALTSMSSPLIAGAFAWFDIEATELEDWVWWASAAAKLVPFDGTCSDVPAGAGSAENSFTASAGFDDAQRGGGYIVDASSDMTITSSANMNGTAPRVRAFIPLPTSNSSTTESQQYRLCFLDRQPTDGTVNTNWFDLSGTTPITVSHLGIVWTLEDQPLQNAPVTVRFTSSSWSFRTDDEGEAAKVVAIDQPCADNASVVPEQIDSSHIGEGFGSNAANGTADLGPRDELHAPYATATFTLPAQSQVKFCYRPMGYQWIEVDQDGTVARRLFSMTDATVTVSQADAIDVGFDANVLAMDPYDGSVIGGAASYVSSAHVTVTLSGSASTDVQYDEYKIVRLSDENGVSIPEASCLAKGVISDSVLTSGSTSITDFFFNFPTASGRYVFCYRRGSSLSEPWIQVPASSAHGNPFTVVSTAVSFSVPSGSTAGSSQRVTVVDEYTNSTVAVQGSLASGDYVYLVNASDTCGYNTSFATNQQLWFSVTRSTYTNDTSALVATRATSASALPSDGAWRVCYYKSQDTATNSTGAMPFVKSGHYQLPNRGLALGSASDFLVLASASSITIDHCPGYNLTYRIPSGKSFRISARLVDTNGELVPLSQQLVTLSGVSSVSKWANSLGYCSADDAPQYAASTGNLIVATENGVAEFDAALVSHCPSTGCRLQFTAEVGGTVLTSPTCHFGVLPTVVSEIVTVVQPAECALGERCRVRAVAYHLDRTVAYSSTDTVTITVAGTSGLQVSAFVGDQQVVVNAPSTTQLSSGAVEVEFVFEAASFAAFPTTASISISFTANQITSTSIDVLIHKPLVTAVHVVDIYPTSFAGVGINPLLPAWEPDTPESRSAGYFTGNLGARVDGQSVVTAAPGYHLLAGQFYTVVLRAVARANGGTERYVDTPALIDSSMAIGVNHGPLNTAGNKFISTEDCLDEFDCQSNFTTVAFTQPKQEVTFRMMNARGCSRASGGCNITFQFNGADIAVGAPTTIVTPVRSIATGLRIACAVAGSPNFTYGGCPPTAINIGWDMRVEAVDDFNDVDEFFDGQLFVRKSDRSLSAFALVGDDAAFGTSGTLARRFVHGVAMVYSITSARSCLVGCEMNFLSDWGANMTTIGGLVTTNPTERIDCEVASATWHCDEYDADFNCLAVGERNYSTSSATLLYSDTQICIDVTAVDANGVRSQHQTNWVYYTASDNANTGAGQVNNSVTLTDDGGNAGFVARYKPLRNGAARFCFTALPRDAAAVAVFDVNFAVQQFNDPGYWSRGPGGQCSVGPFTIAPKKVIGAIEVTSSTGLEDTGSLLVGTRSSNTALSASVDFGLRDHYNASISDLTQLTADDAALHVQFDVTNGTDIVQTSTGSTSIRGVLNVTSTAPSTAISAPSLTFSLDGYGFGLAVSWNLANSSGTVVQRGSVADPSNVTGLVSVARKIYVFNGDASATRRVGFFPGESPLRYWVAGDSTTASSSPPAIFNSSCWTSSCLANEAALLEPLCDDGAGSLLAASAANAPMRMAVFILDPTNGAFDSSYHEPSAGAQIDVLATYTLTLGVGSQVLKCDTVYGDACADDLTATPSQTITALGTTAAEAAVQLEALVDSELPSTRVALYGGYPSAQSSFDASTRVITQSGPLVAQVLSASGVTQLTTGDQHVGWRSNGVPAKVSLLDVARDQDTCFPAAVPCHTGSSGACTYNGTARTGSHTDVAFNYSAQPLHAGIAVPFTLDILDANDERSWFASGSVTVQLESAAGCNNGGTISATSPDAVYGRITTWVTFGSACQGCRLRFTFVPDSTQLSEGLYATLDSAPALYTVVSRTVNVLPNAPNATFAVMTTNTPPPSNLTIATGVALDFAARSNIGNLAVPVTDSVTVVAYNTIEFTRTRSWWWFGNGGVLRPSTSSNPYMHHTASVSTAGGTGTLSAYFTKTCRNGCGLTIAFLTAGQDYGRFALTAADGGSLFYVTTSARESIHVGFTPRYLIRGAATTLSFWEVGSELSSESTYPIAVAGVAATGSGSSLPTTVTSTPVDTTAGDGGRLLTMSLRSVAASTISFAHSLPCTRCTVSAGPFTKTLLVAVQATHLRPFFRLESDAVVTTTVNTPVSFQLRALDDEDTVDELFGQVNCDFSAPFFCKTAADAARVAIDMSADGISSGGFAPDNNEMTVIGNTSLAPTLTASSLVGGRGVVSMSFPAAFRHAVPIFLSQGVSSALVGRSFTVPQISIPSGVIGLQVLVTSVPNIVPVGIPIEVDVGMVTPLTRIISSVANNVMTITPGEGCPAVTISPASGFTLDRGYRRVSLTFSGVPEAGATCQIGFQAAGTAEAACAACSQSVTFNVSTPNANSWQFVRPTLLDNDGSTVGPLFAAAGRRSFITVQLLSTGLGPVGSCPTCTISVGQTLRDAGSAFDACNFTTSGGTFGIDGRATVVVDYAPHSSAYKCSLNIQVRRGSIFVPWATTGLSTAYRDVDVCTPARIQFRRNITDLFRGQLLRTAVAYPFQVDVVDANGVHCRGDSMDDATQLSLGTVAADDTSDTITPIIPAINVNRTGTDTAAFDSGNFATAFAVGASAQVVSGSFTLSVIFAASSVTVKGYADRGFRLSVSSSLGTIYSGRLDTVVAATIIRPDPSTPWPSHAVVNQKFVTGPNLTARLAFQAVDELPPDWVSSGLIRTAPNVATDPSEQGSSGLVELTVDPRPEGVQPLQFSKGENATAELVVGVAAWSSVVWNHTDGEYRFSVVPANPNIQPSVPRSVIIQQPRSLRIADVSGASCASSCLTAGFTASVDTTTGTSIMSIPDITMISITVRIVDSVVATVLGEQRSVVMAQLSSDPRTTVRLGIAPDFGVNGPYYARVERGQATFSFGFIGSTASSASLSGDFFARLSFSCPAERPAHLLLPGESAANPCFGITSATTRSIRVTSTTLATSEFTTPIALANRQTFKMRIPAGAGVALTALRSLSVDVVRALQARNGTRYSYLSPAVARRVMPITTCSVTSLFGDSDLGSSVCHGATVPACSMFHGSIGCPPQVLACDCQNSELQQALSLSVLRRFLLQSSNSTGNATAASTAVEMFIDLSKAPAYRAANTFEVAAEYRAIQADVLAMLANDPVLQARYGYNVSAISLWQWNAVAATAAAPTDAPIPTTTTPPPMETLPPEVISAAPAASSLAVALWLVVAALLMFM